MAEACWEAYFLGSERPRRNLVGTPKKHERWLIRPEYAEIPDPPHRNGVVAPVVLLDEVTVDVRQHARKQWRAGCAGAPVEILEFVSAGLGEKIAQRPLILGQDVDAEAAATPEFRPTRARPRRTLSGLAALLDSDGFVF